MNQTKETETNIPDLNEHKAFNYCQKATDEGLEKACNAQNEKVKEFKAIVKMIRVEILKNT